MPTTYRPCEIQRTPRKAKIEATASTVEVARFGPIRGANGAGASSENGKALKGLSKAQAEKGPLTNAVEE
ncbi:hypothetical protein Tco_0272141 [Tanacetum coccineum]